jgi:glycosyltransferase involved in cell wall biosynthesis
LDQTVSKSKQSEVRQKYRLPSRYLFYPAQFWPHKNHLNLLKAFHLIEKKYPDLQLVLSGSKQNSQSSILNKVHELGLEGRVRILGYVDYADLAALYSLSEMLVMPTLFESVSIPIYEAFAQGVTVCSSNVVALPEQVGDAGLLFDPLNPVDIANSIQKILDDSSLAEKLRKLGRARIQSLTPEIYSAQLSSLVDRVERLKEGSKPSLDKVIRV